ncbi:hypothetical protein [Halorubrum depositum]|uniref:hypothetical protein n=1 Tax=Halorubrum depositum TaxID=2583992 RepID=UPI001642B898
MRDDAFGGRVGFEVDEGTLRVRDELEGAELRLVLDREPDLRPALPELFPLPVDGAVSFEAESLSVPEYGSISVRDDDGDLVAQLNEPLELPRGSYCIEVNGVTKALIRVTDVEIETSGSAGPDPVEIAFDRPRTVTVGARSLHTRPEATITVPDDPTALAEAVSVLGSSIKEFSPERSWPTLRGYPPRIERGDELDIPSPLTVPDTGVEVVVRPTYADVYRLATLSYYLGAEMVTGDAPAIRLDTGYVERLPSEGQALEERATELLRTWFFLDTLARTEGYVPSDRAEYERVGPELPFYPPNLADLSMSERLMEYLEVDPDTVAPYVPTWPTEAVLRPGPATAELLPHLAHGLAPIRVRGSPDPPRPDAPIALATSPQAADTLGPDATAGALSDPDADPVANANGGSIPSPDVAPIPAGASVLTPAAYENALRRPTVERGDVAVAFLVADADRARAIRRSMTDPELPDGIGSWTVSAAPNRETVVGTLSDPAFDVVFCGLPVKDGVVEAADGPADVAGRSAEAEREAPGVTVFEGTDAALAAGTVERGGSSAVALDTVAEPDRIRTFVGLLSSGSSIAVAVRLAFGADGPAARFAGDPATAVAVDRGLPTYLYSVRPVTEGSYRVLLRSFLSARARLGMESWILDPFDSKPFLAGSPWRGIGETDASGLLGIHDEKAPVIRIGDDLVLWSDRLSAEDVAESVRRALSSRESNASDLESRTSD